MSITTTRAAQTRAYEVLLVCLAGALLAVAACVPEGADVTTATASETSENSTGKTSTASASSTSGATATTGASTDATASTAASSTTGDPSSTSSPATTEEPGCNFIGCDDVPPEDPPCDTYMQDCPEGQKCTYNGYPGDHHCVDVPAAPQPPGAPCQAEGGLFDGEDDCDVGGVCWYVDERSGEGECVSFCDGSADAPTCEDPATICVVGCQDCVGMCLKGCDPLADECSEGQVCVPYGGSAFHCVYDASEALGAYLDPCEFSNACDPGLACVDAEFVPGCEGFACCTSFCDLGDPSCPDDLSCFTALDEPTRAFDHVGLCLSKAP